MTSPASRVPRPSGLFWTTKILTTATGEALSDFLVRSFDPVPVVVITFVVFVAGFVLQFTSRRYVPVRYWLFVLLVAVFGTMVADVTHIVIGVPYVISTAVFGAALVVVMLVWHRVERTIDIHSITTDRREVFYWVTVLATFALGTALGDLTASGLGWGFLGSGLVFLALFAMPGLAYRLGAGATTTFWWAYTLSRPLGASFADWLGVAPSRSGLGLGTLTVSAVGIGLIAICVATMSIRRGSPSIVQEPA